MMNKAINSLMLTLPLLACSVQAELKELDNNLVLDTAQNVTWTKDAHLVKTLCDTNDALWQSFDPTAVANSTGRSNTQICNDNGLMNWHEAEAWIAHLNTHTYLGHSDWRQPNIKQIDATCSHQRADDQSEHTTYFGYQCKGSEMSHLFNVTLNNPNHQDNACSPGCLVNTAPFSNVRSDAYWSGTELTSDPSVVGVFNTYDGSIDAIAKESDLQHVWAIRSVQDTNPQAQSNLEPVESTINIRKKLLSNR